MTRSWMAAPGARRFLLKRALRIFPALAFAVFALAFIAGPILTTAPLADYFSAAETWRFLLNIAFCSQYGTLPGVFETAPFAGRVDQSMWTLGFEAVCYGLIAALGADYGGRMLVRTDMATGKSYILSGLYDGKPYNALNDISIDERGRIYFSDPRYLGHEPIFQSGYSVYRLDPDGTVTRIVTDGGKTNGVLVSPDQKTLYVISNDNGYFDFQRLKEGETTSQGRHVLQAYDLAEDGSVSNRRELVDYAPYSGPDGMVADVDGNLYVALRAENRPGIGVFTPDGEELAFISTGEELPTNVGFGRGEERDVLYVTSGKSLYKIKMAKDGYQLP
ncbi:MAG: hypothetical protein HC871_07520 [Rhizobiales bacterium]|nr:hypothetical protein [Hyphomicrobiales bacterium]